MLRTNIVMLSNNELKILKKLGQKKYRNAESAYLIEGFHGVQEALHAVPHLIEYILHVPGIKFSTTKSVQFYELPEHKIASVSQLKNPSGVIAKMNMPIKTPMKPNENVTFYLDNIKDPGNLGTIIRTCDWFGWEQLLLSSECVDEYNPKVVQASMGSIHRVSIYHEETDYLLEDLAATHTIIGTSMDGDDFRKFTPPMGSIIVIGSESHGMSPKSRELAGAVIGIPRSGGAESLNASISHAIFCAQYSH